MGKLNYVEKLSEQKQSNNIIQMDENWKQRLDINDKGKVIRSRHNIQTVLNYDENIKDIGRLNLFSDQIEIFNIPPWRKKDDANPLWSDRDDAQLRNYFSLRYGIENQSGISDCMEAVFYRNSYHPIKEYLTSVTWDGVKRLENLFIDFLGALDYEYSRVVTKKMLVAAVARVFEPGVKFDNALILLGKQGSGKSHVLSRLGGEWFNESISSFKGDEALMKLRNSWIIELAELSALKGSEVEEAKGFISARRDSYRPKYGRNIARFPRQCVFFGSTNNFEFLKDRTGNRRFWALPIDKNKRNKDPFIEMKDEYVNQVWAEAFQLYQGNEPLYIGDVAVNKEAERLQTEHISDDGMTGEIEKYLKGQVVTCARELWFECLGNERQPKRHEISDINDIMRNLPGWENLKSTFGKYGQQRGFRRIL